jgi:hypothetical protein
MTQATKAPHQAKSPAKNPKHPSFYWERSYFLLVGDRVDCSHPRTKDFVLAMQYAMAFIVDFPKKLIECLLSVDHFDLWKDF